LLIGGLTGARYAVAGSGGMMTGLCWEATPHTPTWDAWSGIPSAWWGRQGLGIMGARSRLTEAPADHLPRRGIHWEAKPVGASASRRQEY